MRLPKSVKSTLVLVCICAVVASALAVTNFFTAPLIRQREDNAVNEALLEVLPEGGGFEKMDLSPYELPASVAEAYKASNGGYVFRLTVSGYSAGMVILCGVGPDGTVKGTVCLSSNETLGIEKTYGSKLVGTDLNTVEAVDTVSNATKTTEAYRSAVRDALRAAVILDGGSVDLRTEEEILADQLAEALPEANGSFTKLFFSEEVDAVDAVYTASNGVGAVCVIGDRFIGVDKEGDPLSEELPPELAASVKKDMQTVTATVKSPIDLTAYEELPAALLSAEVTHRGDYVLELRAAGFGINGDPWYGPSGEYIYLRVSLTGAGKIIDCLTLSQQETDGIGAACGKESFYGQFDGKTRENYREVDAIAGATLTTNGYKTAILRAFEAVEIFERGERR